VTSNYDVLERQGPGPNERRPILTAIQIGEDPVQHLGRIYPNDSVPRCVVDSPVRGLWVCAIDGVSSFALVVNRAHHDRPLHAGEETSFRLGAQFHRC
jgi:hypothetical protein